MIVLTDYVDDYDFKYLSGLILIGLYAVSFVVNLCVYLYCVIKHFLSKRRSLALFNQARAKKFQDEQAAKYMADPETPAQMEESRNEKPKLEVEVVG